MREIKMAQAIEECRRMEIRVLAPDINASIHDFSIEEGNIRFGLSAIKNVGSAAIESIMEARKKVRLRDLRIFCIKLIYAR